MDERIIDRKLFIDLANEVGLNASHIEAMGEMRHCEITVSGNMLERLVEIQHQFERFAVMGDDEYRGFYIEVPRPTSEEWGDVEELIASGEYQSKEAFLADWLAFNPTETQWFHVTSYKYEEFRSIRITDRKHAHFVITNRSSCADGESDDGWYQDSLARLFCYLQRLVDVIVANPDGFNDYVAHNLPCQQRIGRIARKELNRIAPSFKINVEDRETAIKALEDSAKEHSARKATDHYGELGFSRLNIIASKVPQQGWMIVVSNSYSANVELAIEVATALYKVGVPLLIRDAEKLLRILREEDYVRLIPNTYHNYMGYQEEGTVYELPWEYECSDDSESDLTLEQYNAIVSLAEWQDEELVKPIE